MLEINKVVEGIEKKYGKGSIISFDENITEVERVSSSCLSLDIALGGGYPKGRIIEIVGEESTGKTTLAIMAAIQVQKQGKVAAYIDVEHSFDPSYAENIGLDLSRGKFLFSQPSNGEEALGIAEELLKTKEIGIIIIDSVAALIPKAELEGEFGDSKMGLQARLMSQAMRKLVGQVNQSQAFMIFINQLRDQIGVMFGDAKIPTGGNALKFYSSQRLRLYSSGNKKDDSGKLIASTIRCKIIKNKVSPPFKEARFDIVFGEGVDDLQTLVDLAVEQEIIKKSGSWYSYLENKLGQGVDAVKNILKDNPELVSELEFKVKQNYGLIQE